MPPIKRRVPSPTPPTRARFARAAKARQPIKPVQPTQQASAAAAQAASKSAGRKSKVAQAPAPAPSPGLALVSPDASVRAPAWFERMYSGTMEAEYKRYMRDEWGFEKRGDRALFEKLCLEGAQAGLSWATILKKRNAYRTAFAGFDIEACAAMGDADVERLLLPVPDAKPEETIIRHRGKIASVGGNARCVLELVREREAAGLPAAAHGRFDQFLWAFVGGAPKLNRWATTKDIPCEDEASVAMSKELKRRGFKFVGPKICYSLMQSCGLVIDHPLGTPEWEAAAARLGVQ